MICINRLKDLSKRYVQVGEDVRIRGRASTYKRGREYEGVREDVRGDGEVGARNSLEMFVDVRA